MDCATAGAKRWQGMTAEQRSEAQRAAANKRWAREREKRAAAEAGAATPSDSVA